MDSYDEQNNQAPNEDKEIIPSDLQGLLDQADTLVGLGQYGEARKKLDSVLQAAQPDSPAALSARLDLAQIQLFEGTEITVAREVVKTCLREIGSADLKCRQTALSLLGEVEARLGNVGEAHSVFLEARSLARERKNRFSEAHALVGLSHTEELRGNLIIAEQLIDEAIELYRTEYRQASNDNSRRKAAANLAAGLSTRAHLLTHGGRLTEALVSLENALPFFKEADSQDNIGRTLLLKAELLLTEAKWQDGFALLQEAGSIFHGLGNTEWECRCLRHLSRLMETLGEPGAAWRFLSHAVSLLNSSHWSSSTRVPYLLDLAYLAWKHDQPDKARELIEKAKELAGQSEPDGILADCFLAEASTIRGNGEQERGVRRTLFEAATKDIEAALARCEIRGRRAVFMERLGTLHGYREDVRQSRLWFERSLREFDSIGDVSGVARCLGAIAAAAKADNDDAQAIEVLERVLELTKVLPLYHIRAGALHDLALLKVSHHHDIEGAKKCLSEAQALAKKHEFQDVLDFLKYSWARLEHIERLGQPSERDLTSLITELQEWCKQYPAMREAIVPLWYFVHQAEIWGLCRTMLGIKFLICSSGLQMFHRAVEVLQAQGDLFVFGLPFNLTRTRQTELVPWPIDALIPPHVSVVFLKKEGNLDEQENDSSPAEVAQALVNTLKDRPYVLVPFSEPFEGISLYAMGHHVRLPECVSEVMLDDLVVEKKQICLPLGENTIEERESTNHREDVGLVYAMRVAWEYGMIPVFVGGLPPVHEVQVVAATAITLCASGDLTEETDARKARQAWSNFVRPHQNYTHDLLMEFRDVWLNLEKGVSGGQSSTVRATAYLLQFYTGVQQVVYPAVLLPS